jgi:predicted enzyme related to lactoylglutathione lyase
MQCKQKERPIMEVQSFAINLTSEQPQPLFEFYRDVVGLPLQPEMGDHALVLGGATLFVDGHSQTKGAAREPQRALLDLFVGDIASEQARLEKAGVTFIRNAEREYWGGVISTFLDPDGNYCQLIEFKPE